MAIPRCGSATPLPRKSATPRELLPEKGVPGADHVLIGRNGGIERDFAALRAELAKALAKAAR
jgi:ribonuclease P protein component